MLLLPIVAIDALDTSSSAISSAGRKKPLKTLVTLPLTPSSMMVSLLRYSSVKFVMRVKCG